MIAQVDAYESERDRECVSDHHHSLDGTANKIYIKEMLSNTSNESYYNSFDNLYYNTSNNYSSSIITDDTDITAGFGVGLSDGATTIGSSGSRSFDVDMLKSLIETEEKRNSATSISSFRNSRNDSSNGRSKRSSVVHFSDVTIQEYPIQPGDNPGGTIGCPITIGWDPIGLPVTVSVDKYEHFRGGDKNNINSTNTNNCCYFNGNGNNNKHDYDCCTCTRRSSSELNLVSAHREHILKRLGYSTKAIRAGTKSANQARRRRYNTIARLKSSKSEEFLEGLRKTVRNVITCGWEQRRERAYLTPFLLSSSLPLSKTMDESTGTSTTRDCSNKTN